MDMTALLPRFARPLFSIACVASFSLIGTSCKTAGGGSEYPDYVSSTQDSGYNPYPSASSSQYQTYAPSTPTPPAQQYQSYTPEPSYTPDTSSYSSYTPPASKPKPKPKPKPAVAKKKATPARGGSYLVKQGDTLYRIALNRGTTVAKLKSANGLSSDVIRPGQRLVIP